LIDLLREAAITTTKESIKITFSSAKNSKVINAQSSSQKWGNVYCNVELKLELMKSLIFIMPTKLQEEGLK